MLLMIVQLIARNGARVMELFFLKSGANNEQVSGGCSQASPKKISTNLTLHHTQGISITVPCSLWNAIFASSPSSPPFRRHHRKEVGCTVLDVTAACIAAGGCHISRIVAEAPVTSDVNCVIVWVACGLVVAILLGACVRAMTQHLFDHKNDRFTGGLPFWAVELFKYLARRLLEERFTHSPTHPLTDPSAYITVCASLCRCRSVSGTKKR